MDADTLILWINAGGAATAALVNAWAALTGWKDWRIVRGTVAVFAAFYAASYVTFALGWWSLEQWSPFMRGVSVPVWLIVWCWPAVHSTLIWRRIVRQVADLNAEKEPVNHG